MREEPEQPVKLPHLHNLGSPAYLELSGTMVGEWKKTDPAQRRDAETKMQAQWKKWMADNAKMFVDVGAGVGKTKLVNTRGMSDTKNDIMLYSVVQAESHEAAAKSFEGHPHLQIPQSSIEVMEIHSLQGMA